MEFYSTELYRSRRFMPWVFNAQTFQVSRSTGALSVRVFKIEELAREHRRSIAEETREHEIVRDLDSDVCKPLMFNCTSVVQNFYSAVNFVTP